MSEAAEAAQLSPGHGPHPAYPPGYPPRHHLDPRDSPGPGAGAGAGHRTTSPGAGPGAGFGRTNIPHHRHYGDTRQADPPKPAQQGQFGHCPKVTTLVETLVLPHKILTASLHPRLVTAPPCLVTSAGTPRTAAAGS